MTASVSRWSALSLLIVDDEPGLRSFLAKALAKRFAQIETAASVEEAEALRCRLHFDLIITDIRLPGRSGIEWHEAIDPATRRSDVIFMTGYGDMETTLKALRLGASDFILKPFNLDQMIQAVDRVIDRRQMEQENLLLRREVSKLFPNTLIGDSAKTRELKTLIARVAPSNAAVLVEGESGTGKELVARALHQLSGRAGAFVPLNCAAIAPELLESELFGHVQGAFTGARKGRDGLFRVAHQGTLFLDEIGEMPLTMQSSLLRALEQKAIRPVGAEREMAVDVRIVAATNRNLKLEVDAGRFREDLFYRLNVVALPVTPLRDRTDDIPALVHHFTRQLTTEMGIGSFSWTHEDVVAMQAYPWPGNVRELRNLIERCLLLGKPPASYWQSTEPSDQSQGREGYPTAWTLAEVEKSHILRVVASFEGNKSASSRVLGVARKTLERKFKEWAIE